MRLAQFCARVKHGSQKTETEAENLPPALSDFRREVVGTPSPQGDSLRVQNGKLFYVRFLVHPVCMPPPKLLGAGYQRTTY